MVNIKWVMKADCFVIGTASQVEFLLPCVNANQNHTNIFHKHCGQTGLNL